MAKSRHRVELPRQRNPQPTPMRRPIRVLVYGGRDCSEMKCFEWLSFHGRDAVATMIPSAWFKIETVVHGNACGADKAGGRWARAIGAREHPFDAEWQLSGLKASGKLRNKVMADHAKVDCAIEFPGDRGTEDMRLRLAGRDIPFYFAIGDFKA